MSYPLGVVATGLYAVYDRRPAATGAYTLDLPANAPADWTLGGVTYEADLGVTLNSLDGTDYNLFLNGGTYNFDNLKLYAQTGGNHILSVGDVDYGAAATVNITNGQINLSNSFNRGELVTGPGSTLNLTNTYVHDASMAGFDSAGTTNLTRCFVKNAGLNPEADPDPHAELIHVLNNTTTASETYLLCETGLSLAIHLEAFTGAASLTLRDCIVDVATAINGLSPIQATPRNGNCTLVLDNVALKAGTGGGYLIVNTGSGVVHVTATNCFDLDTGADITATLNAQGAGTAVVSSGAMTLRMGMAGSVGAYGSIISSGAMTLTMGAMAGQVSQAVASGDMTLTMGMAGTVTQATSASASGDMVLSMGMSGAAVVGASAFGAMVLTMGMDGLASASGLVAKVRNGNARTAPPGHGSRTVTAA